MQLIDAISIVSHTHLLAKLCGGGGIAIRLLELSLVKLISCRSEESVCPQATLYKWKLIILLMWLNKDSWYSTKVTSFQQENSSLFKRFLNVSTQNYKNIERQLCLWYLWTWTATWGLCNFGLQNNLLITWWPFTQKVAHLWTDVTLADFFFTSWTCQRQQKLMNR